MESHNEVSSVAEHSDADLLIIGGGVAGLSAAIYGARSALHTVVLDGTGTALGAGGQAAEIADLENYPGVFPATDGMAFIQSLQQQAEHFGAVIVHDYAVSLDKVSSQAAGGEGVFSVHGGSGQEYRGRTAVLATGCAHRKLSVKGEAEFFGKGVSYCATCDGPFFKGKQIVVVGGGDSALSEALYLATLSPFVTIVHRRDAFRASPSLQKKIGEHGIKTVMGAVVKEIIGTDRVQQVVAAKANEPDGAISTLPCDAVFVCVGTVPRGELVDFLPKDAGGYIKTDERMQTACKGLFAAGDVRSGVLHQVVTAAADGAVAACSAASLMT